MKKSSILKKVAAASILMSSLFAYAPKEAHAGETCCDRMSQVTSYVSSRLSNSKEELFFCRKHWLTEKCIEKQILETYSTRCSNCGTSWGSS